ncbi:MAG: hypothetical protein A2049_01860 [Elusimicrobia bacterium GWA2_62_23]|nr:MAG: hypothetical protein A2049_01860 [Elusimicrobia bacterium GWA2_62_23]HBB66623.1 hypothetical protein [Elusimicrobiota bacterium]
MKNTKLLMALSGVLAFFLGLAAKNSAVTDFQERLGKSVNIENALFADDTKTPPAKSALG